MIGCGLSGSSVRMQLGWAGLAGGCLLINTSLTVGEVGLSGSAAWVIQMKDSSFLSIGYKV